MRFDPRDVRNAPPRLRDAIMENAAAIYEEAMNPKYITLQKDTKDITTEEALAAWDSGGSVWSVEMGGLGPGYEQCIQILAFEMVRALLPHKSDMDASGWSEPKIERAKIEVLDPLVHRMDRTYGFSGAQVGAAQSIAGNIVRRGYGVAVSDPSVKDRLIQVSAIFPNAVPDMWWEYGGDSEEFAVENPEQIADRLDDGTLFRLQCAKRLPDEWFVSETDEAGRTCARPASSEEVVAHLSRKNQ